MMKMSLELFDEFIEKWPVTRINSITIDEYTNLSLDSFTYDLESKMRALGSIKGGSSFKFGIFKREDKTKHNSQRGLIYTDDYAWYKKYGDNKKEVFENVKSLVNQTITYSQNSKLQDIESVNLGDVYKWKIAFHYQNKNDFSIVPVFKYDALKHFLEISGDYKKEMTLAEMYTCIKEKNDISTLDKAYDLAVNIWNEFVSIDIVEESSSIKKNKEMTESRKSNATSNLECIEYEIKAHKIKYRNRHNQLEKSFEKFLNNIQTQAIKKDESYIDFQFVLADNKYICELKPTDSQTEIKYAVRSATGQILGYSFDKNFDYNVIVFQDKPNTENELFLKYLKNNHNIFYLYELSEGVFQGNIL